MQQAGARLARLAHADDAAAAGFHARGAHVVERIEAILVIARVDDLAVELRRAIQVVIVVIQARRFQRLRLRRAQHAERRAGFHAERAHRADHLGDLLHIAILGRAPCRAHAEARRAGSFRLLRLVDDGVERHEFFRLHTGCIARALRTVGAVLGTAAGLDRQQRRHLHCVCIVVGAMRVMRAREQIIKRQREQREHLGAADAFGGGTMLLRLTGGDANG